MTFRDIFDSPCQHIIWELTFIFNYFRNLPSICHNQTQLFVIYIMNSFKANEPTHKKLLLCNHGYGLELRNKVSDQLFFIY